MFRVLLIAFFALLLSGCGDDSNVSPSAPRIENLRVVPDVICVGTTADISFTVFDANNDEVLWAAKLSSGEHGGVVPSQGLVPSGTTVTTQFDAATSGSHSHNVKLTIQAADDTGLISAPADVDLFVFNCS
jgi:hypothetical protein